MGLNIKNARVHDLARRAAEVTGKTQTGAIEEALERLLWAYSVDPDGGAKQARIDVVQRLAAEYRGTPAVGVPEIRSIGDLYDESGLPA